MKTLILKYALQNAVKFNGKANPGAVIGKILQEKPELKEKIKELMKDIHNTVKEVNSWTLEKQLNEIERIEPGLLENKKEEKKRELHELANAHKGKVVMRFAPNANGPLSLGRSRQALLNWFYVQKYKGKFILRFDDTDPKGKYPLKEAYKWIENDLKFFNIKISKKAIQSSRLKIYYKYAADLIRKNSAYICTCNVEEYRKLRDSKIECPCRNLGINEQLKRWKKMFNSYKEGEAVYRVKTNIMDPNPAARDWPGFRIVEKKNNKHPLQKKAKVWPLLNFASAIDDKLLGVTYIIRGIDLQISDVRQKYLYSYFGWEYPETIYTGKLIFNDIKSTSKTRELIKQGKLIGWDDPRLLTIMALKRRGFQAKALANFIKDLGVNKNNVNVSFDTLASYNKEEVDNKANRYFLILNPVQIKIKNAPKQKLVLNLHPELRKKGRKFNVNENFFIEKKDYDMLNENRLYRLMDCLNFKIEGGNFIFISKKYEEYKDKGERIMHWLPENEKINVEVYMDNGETKKGFGEKNLLKVKENEVIQAERMAFLRCDKKMKNKMVFFFGHR